MNTIHFITTKTRSMPMKQAFFLGLVVLIIAIIVSFAPPSSLSDAQAGAGMGIGHAINVRLGKSVIPADRVVAATRDTLAKKLKTAPPKEAGVRCDSTTECRSGLYCISRDAQGRVRFDAPDGGICTPLATPRAAPEEVQAAAGPGSSTWTGGRTLPGGPQETMRDWTDMRV